MDNQYTQVGSAESEIFFDKKRAIKFLDDTINQVAGKLEMRNRETGGAVVRVRIPYHVGIESQMERRLEDRGDYSHRDRRRRAASA